MKCTICRVFGRCMHLRNQPRGQGEEQTSFPESQAAVPAARGLRWPSLCPPCRRAFASFTRVYLELSVFFLVLCPPWILTSAPSRDTGPRAFHRLPLSSILPRAHPSDLSPVCQFSPSWTGFPLCASPRAGQASPCLCLRHVLPFTLRYPIHFQQSFAQSCFVPRSCWMG